MQNIIKAILLLQFCCLALKQKMKILYLETSSKNCSVAISDNEKLLCLCEEVSENYKQSESLHTYVEWALEGAGDYA